METLLLMMILSGDRRAIERPHLPWAGPGASLSPRTPGDPLRASADGNQAVIWCVLLSQMRGGAEASLDSLESSELEFPGDPVRQAGGWAAACP